MSTRTLSLLTFACSHGAPGDFEFGGSCCGTPCHRQACAGVGHHLEIGDVAKRSCKVRTALDSALTTVQPGSSVAA